MELKQEYKYISRKLPILDGVEKVTGSLAYGADMAVAECLHAKILFSPHPHAKVLRVDVDAALALPGVQGVFHHGNTPAGVYNSTVWYEGQRMLEDERMFPPIVRHIGDRVAAVVADSQEIADHALGLVTVEYELLPACFCPFEALKTPVPEKTPIGIPDFANPAETLEVSYGDAPAVIEAAEFVARDRVSTPKTHHGAIENHICFAKPLPDGRIEIHSPCQSVFSVQIVVAKALGLAASDIKAVKAPIGGSFGGKAEPVLDPLCAYFARALDRPVRIEFNRRESITSTRSRSKAVGEIATAVDREGNILARDVDAVIDIGAYLTGGGFLPGSMAQRMNRLYDVKNINYRGRAVYTNTVVTGAFRGYGSPQIHAISEINLDHAARLIGMDPAALRRRNLVRPYAEDPTGASNMGNARPIDCLDRGGEAFDWTARWLAPKREGRFRRGVGMACATHINGCFPTYEEATTVRMRLREDETVELICALHDLGCGSITAIAQIVAETLDIPPGRIRFSAVDSDTCPYDLGTRASRMTYICGEASRRTAVLLRERILEEAARILNRAGADLEMRAGVIHTSYGPESAISFGELAAFVRESGTGEVEAENTYAAVGNPGSYAAHFTEVEVDIHTGTVRILDYLAAHDLGRSINRQMVEGQIYGGVQMGAGYALMEDVDVDPETGRLRADSFSRYHMINAPDMPEVRVILVEEHEDAGPYGAKAVGEIATIPVAPAVVNAVNHALGTNLTELPLTQERIVAALSG